jgi:hypothetical protein
MKTQSSNSQKSSSKSTNEKERSMPFNSAHLIFFHGLTSSFLLQHNEIGTKPEDSLRRFTEETLKNLEIKITAFCSEEIKESAEYKPFNFKDYEKKKPKSPKSEQEKRLS